MKTNKDSLLMGAAIYRNKHNLAIYYRKWNKRGYIIPFDSETTFKRFQSRFIIPVLVFVFTYVLFNLHIAIALILAALAFALMEYRFLKFLDNCSIIENFDTTKFNRSTPQIQNQKHVVLRLIIYIALGILLFVNAFMTASVAADPILKTLNISLALTAFFFAGKLALEYKR